MKENKPTVWRTKLRSALEGVDFTKQFEHCFEKQLIGIGWGIDGFKSDSSLDSVTSSIEAVNWKGRGKAGADTVRRLALQAKRGDFVWTRHTDGKYWLARISGDYRYDGSKAAWKVDVHQTRRVEWILEGMNDLDVPGGVVRSFIGPGQSFRRIHDRATNQLTPYLWKKALGEELPRLDLSPIDVLREVLDPYDVEDLIYMWLQVEKGYVALPRTQQKSTPAYEWTMVHHKDGHKGIVQVKTGRDKVDLKALSRARDDDTTKTYAFATSGLAPGDDPADVTEVITPEELLQFVRGHRKLLPERLRLWFELAGSRDDHS